MPIYRLRPQLLVSLFAVFLLYLLGRQSSDKNNIMPSIMSSSLVHAFAIQPRAVRNKALYRVREHLHHHHTALLEHIHPSRYRHLKRYLCSDSSISMLLLARHETRSFSSKGKRISSFSSSSRLLFSSYSKDGNDNEYQLYYPDQQDDPSNSFYSVRLCIPTSYDMEELGALISIVTNPPDSILLHGDLGTGKTSFSRGFISCKTEEVDDTDSGDVAKTGSNDNEKTKSLVRVTSPTYLLSQTYKYNNNKNDRDFLNESIDQSTASKAVQSVEIHHIDFYRLLGKSKKEFDPLNLPHVFQNCISLMEWPCRLLDVCKNNNPSTNDKNVDDALRSSTATSGTTNEDMYLPNPFHRLDIEISILDDNDDTNQSNDNSAEDDAEQQQARLVAFKTRSDSKWKHRLQQLIEDGFIDDWLISTS